MKHINRRKLLLFLFDLACFCFAGLVFLFLYTNGAPSGLTLTERFIQLGLIVLCVFCGRIAFRCYTNIWRYARAAEYFRMILADFCGGLWFLVVRMFVPFQIEFLRAVTIVTLGCLSCLAARFVYQLLQGRSWQRDNEPESAVENVNVAIIGAGRLGATLAKELAQYGIRVNAVAPGFIATDMIDQIPEEQRAEHLKAVPLGRFGEAEEVGKLVRTLCSDDMAYVTGQTIVMDGGLSL